MKLPRLLLTFALIVSLCTVLTSCGTKINDEEVSKTEDTAAVNTPKAEAPHPVLQKMVDEFKVSEQYETLKTSMGDNGEMEFRAEGSTLIMSCTVKADVTEEAKSTLTELVDAIFKPISQGMLDELKKEGVESPSFIIEYLDKNGDIIVSREYK